VGNLVTLCTGGQFGHFTLMVGDLVTFMLWLAIWASYVLAGETVLKVFLPLS